MNCACGATAPPPSSPASTPLPHARLALARSSVKDASTASQKAERIWTPSRSQPGVAAFQGTFVASGYGSPNGRCDGGSPTSGTGCGAQWAALDAVGLALKVICALCAALWRTRRALADAAARRPPPLITSSRVPLPSSHARRVRAGGARLERAAALWHGLYD